MIYKPMLFSGPMVRAILDRTKTQTRRIIKPQPVPDRYHPTDGLEWNPKKFHYTECNVNWNPISKAFKDFVDNGHAPHPVGSRIWVRETFQSGIGLRLIRNENSPNAPRWIYRADELWELPEGTNWRPSIFMPKQASRIDLEVTNVRVERLQDISEEDARAEGIEQVGERKEPTRDGVACWSSYGQPEPYFNSPIDSYHALWQSINGKGSWELNPLVFVYEFRRVRP